MGTSKSEKKRRRKANSSDRSPSPSGSRRRRRTSYSRSRSRSPEHLRFQLKALKYVTRGNAGRLRKLLRNAGDAAAGLAAVDSQSRTLLHQACACGHGGVVALLLRYGASAAAVDAFGDTPAHLAARAGHLEALAEAMRGPGAPTLDAAGAGGTTLSQLMDRAIRGRDSTALAHAGAGAGPSAAEARAEDDDARWRRRLREECSEGEEPSEDGWQGARGPERYGDSDDEWANRLWHQMQRRRAAAASASVAAFTADMRAENARRAAEAAERSARILRDEQAKDTDWRRRTLAIGPGPAAAAPDLTAARVAYDERWAQLDREAAAAAAGGSPLRYRDIPWPLEPGPALGPQPVTASPPAVPPPAPSADSLRDFLLLGAAGPSDVKRRLRCELLRWHPDKFGARFGARLAAAGAAHRAVALAHVQQLAQVLTQVLGRGGGGA